MISKQKARFVNLGLYIPGLAIYLLPKYFIEGLSDFQLGFAEGVSLTLIVAGLVYTAWCLNYFKQFFLKP